MGFRNWFPEWRILLLSTVDNYQNLLSRALNSTISNLYSRYAQDLYLVVDFRILCFFYPIRMCINISMDSSSLKQRLTGNDIRGLNQMPAFFIPSKKSFSIISKLIATSNSIYLASFMLCSNWMKWTIFVKSLVKRCSRAIKLLSFFLVRSKWRVNNKST